MSLRYLSPLALPALGAEDLREGNAVGSWVEGLGRTRRFLRYAPEFIDDPSGCGIFKGLHAAVYESPPVFVSALSQVDLVGYRTTISGGSFRNDEMLLDGMTAEAAFLDRLDNDDRFLNEETGLRRHGGDAMFTLEQGSRARRDISGTTVVLCSHEPSNYGSFLFRVVPKLVTLRELGLRDLPVLVWAWPDAFRQILALIDAPEHRIIQHDLATVSRLERALVPSLRNPNAYMDHESYALMQALSDRCMGPLSGRRLYISRLKHGKTSGTTRVMLNEAELAASLARLNFEVIEPERLSIKEQIATFESADMIVAPSGSAMFNIMFCRPGTKVIDIESEPNWIYAHAGLFASCQMRYGLFVGQVDPADERPVHRRWTVNIDALMDRISSFIHA